tara:strand:- start:3641 stop:4045 length:405 start_codon:yes stop_codon:yes gene_type:complete
MIGDLLTNPVFLTVGTLAAIVATLAIFKKLFKVTFIILLLFVVFAITIVYTGEDPKDLTKKAKASMKEIERDAKDVKKVVTTTVSKIDDLVPKEAKKSMEKTVSKTMNKIDKEKKKALKKLEKDLKKYKKELGN